MTGLDVHVRLPGAKHPALDRYLAALAAAVRSTETRSRLSPQGRQSGGDSRNAPKDAR